MALLCNPKSELFAAPELLIPGKQPVGAVGINRVNLLTDGLKLCVLGRNVLHDLTGANWSLQAGTPTGGIVGAGPKAYMPPAPGIVDIDDTLYYRSSYKQPGGTFGRTLLFDGYIISTGTEAYLFAIGQSGGSGTVWRVRVESSRIRVEVGSGYHTLVSSVSGRRAIIGVVQPPSSNVTDSYAFLDGVKKDTTFGSTTRAVNTTSDYPQLFANSGSSAAITSNFGSSSVKAQFNYMMFWERALSDSEIISLTHNPYQFLVPA